MQQSHLDGRVKNRWQAGAALVKGGFMLIFGLGVLGEAIHKALYPVMPGTEVMGIVGVLALTANLACFVLLYRHRGDNLNMSSTWLCSRNDLIAVLFLYKSKIMALNSYVRY